VSNGFAHEHVSSAIVVMQQRNDVFSAVRAEMS
jgi:hypothetical protein